MTHDDWQDDEWEVMGNAELEVMACIDKWGELLCRVWALEREISNRNVARIMARPHPVARPYTRICAGIDWAKSVWRLVSGAVG